MLAAAQMHPVNLLTTFVWPGLAFLFPSLPFPSLLLSFPFLVGCKEGQTKTDPFRQN